MIVRIASGVCCSIIFSRVEQTSVDCENSVLPIVFCAENDTITKYKTKSNENKI